MGISDDGRLIAATISGESGGPKGSIYVRKTDGSPPVRVGDGGAYALSPDAKWVSGYITDNSGRRRFELFPTGAGEEFATDVAGLGNVPVHGWVSGGRYLVVGNLPGKKTQCFAWDAHTGSVKSVCPEGIPHRLEIYVSPDGNQVLSEGPRGGWFVYPVEGGRPQQVNGIAAGEEPFGWRSDNRSLYLKPQRTGDTATPVWSLDPGTGRRTLWKEIRPSQPVEFRYDLHLHITPDGSAYAYNISAQTSDLYLAQGLR